jgi:hypothetical protein
MADIAPPPSQQSVREMVESDDWTVSYVLFICKRDRQLVTDPEAHDVEYH